jgi:hypothetical protein
MNLLKATALGLAMLTLAGGGAIAAGTGAMMKSGGTMKTASMAATPGAMSAKDIKACNAMSHEMMMKAKACAAMAKMHPNAMQGEAMMQPGAAMASGSMAKGR